MNFALLGVGTWAGAEHGVGIHGALKTFAVLVEDRIGREGAWLAFAEVCEHEDEA